MYTDDVAKKQTEKPTTDLGRFLRQWREDENLTVEEAASRAGFGKSIWTKIENGQKRVALETLFAISNLTGRTMEDLVIRLGWIIRRSRSSEDRAQRMAALVEVEPKAAALLDLLPDLTPDQIDTMLTVGESLRRKDQR
jgi:transcriptional regulator with XRE-family HTH domain